MSKILYQVVNIETAEVTQTGLTWEEANNCYDRLGGADSVFAIQGVTEFFDEAVSNEELLRKQLDHYRRAFRDLNEAVAEFFHSPDGDAFKRLSRIQNEINER